MPLLQQHESRQCGAHSIAASRRGVSLAALSDPACGARRRFAARGHTTQRWERGHTARYAELGDASGMSIASMLS